MLKATVLMLVVATQSVSERGTGEFGPGRSAFPATYAAQGKLMIFGGTTNRVYLGCLNCSRYATDSVLNRYGPHGSPYRSDSIFNRYGPYGSRYSETSACSRHAADPPVIVDEQGNFYGRLTMNRVHPQATRNLDLLAWLAQVCDLD